MNRARASRWLIIPLLCGCSARPRESSAGPSLPAHYVIIFDNDKGKFSAAALQTLKEAGRDAVAHRGEFLQVIGHASENETNADKLAHDRALYAAGYLINNFPVDPGMMSEAHTSGPGETPSVELILGAKK